ncbi:hypothetical protein ACHAQD_008450 [Fusarium lateritium]
MAKAQQKIHQDCADFRVVTWDKPLIRAENTKWNNPRNIHPIDFSDQTLHPVLRTDSHVVVIFADADKVRECGSCKKCFTDEFRVPELWWSSYSRRSNGYFGSETIRDDEGEISSLNTWSRFLVKQLHKRGHSWHKFNIFTHWVASSQQTFLVVFEAPKQLGLRDRFPDPLLKDSHKDVLSDPFWFYPRLFDELSILQDNTVWAVRDRVRNIEKTQLRKKSNPNYRSMHDMARHAIHVSETLEVAEKTVAAIVQQHNAFQEEVASDDKREKARYRHVGERMIWYDHILQSLRCRASANKERLHNEIQLGFNSVAVDIGRATQSDSAAMKTIAFVSLTFLPATFISALFSMSFFKVDDDTGVWSVSGKFWLYWVIAIPVTLLTGGLWLLWQKVYQPPRIGEDEPSVKKYRNLLAFLNRGGDKADEIEMA